jgi:hypothetical protein
MVLNYDNGWRIQECNTAFVLQAMAIVAWFWITTTAGGFKTQGILV